MSSPIGHRVVGVVPLLAGRSWERVARDLQEYLERLQKAAEGMPSDTVLSQISDAVQDDVVPAADTASRLVWALQIFDKDC